MESWHSSCVKARLSPLIPRGSGVLELSSRCCAEFGVPLELGRCSWGISGVALMMSNHLSCLMVNAGWLLSLSRAIGPRLVLIFGTQNSFLLLR